jgi:hypothetical protein
MDQSLMALLLRPIRLEPASFKSSSFSICSRGVVRSIIGAFQALDSGSNPGGSMNLIAGRPRPARPKKTIRINNEKFVPILPAQRGPKRSLNGTATSIMPPLPHSHGLEPCQPAVVLQSLRDLHPVQRTEDDLRQYPTRARRRKKAKNPKSHLPGLRKTPKLYPPIPAMVLLSLPQICLIRY